MIKVKDMGEDWGKPLFLIYGRENCMHCVGAKLFLKTKDYEFVYVDINVDVDADKKAKIISDSGMRTVPIIYDKEYRVGGYEELVEYLS